MARQIKGHLLVSLLLLVLQAPGMVAQECDADGVCDQHERCSVWLEEGECLLNPEYMREHCPISCREQFKITPTGAKCEDLHPRCGLWASLGECQDNPTQMSRYCAKSCDACGDPEDESCKDHHENCGFWAEKGECSSNARYMENSCRKSCGLCQKDSAVRPPGSGAGGGGADEEKTRVLMQTDAFGIRQHAEGEHALAVYEGIKKSIEYMNSDSTRQLSQGILAKCKNQHEFCSFWAHIGECENNKAWMQTNCSPSCMACHSIDA